MQSAGPSRRKLSERLQRQGMVPPDGERRFVPALLLSTALTGGCHPNHAPVPAPVQVAAAADLSVAFGPSSNQEMCYNFAYSYPAGALDNGVPSLVGATNTCW